MVRRCLLALVVAGVVALGVALVESGPARTVPVRTAPVEATAAPVAAAAGRTASADGVLVGGCLDHPWTYALTLRDDIASWSARVVLDSADGDLVDSDFLSGYGDRLDGSGAFLICSYAGAGRYRISVDVTTYDADHVRDVTALPDTTFVMREGLSRTRLTVRDRTPALGQVVSLRVESRTARPSGFYDDDDTTVRLQVRLRGHWRRVLGSMQATDSAGRHDYRYRWDVQRPLRLRAVTFGADGVRQSVSRAVTVARPTGTRPPAGPADPADPASIRPGLRPLPR